jgi:hypothetical protein
MINAERVASHLTTEQLEAGMEHILRSPADKGPLVKIVRRPGMDQREVLAEGQLDVDIGLVGDNWKTRGSTGTPDGSANPVAQITMINSRFLSLIAQSEKRWQLSGDQLLVDLDLSIENLPPGTQLSIGSAVIEVSAKPHTGCAKFSARFGRDALRITATPKGTDLRLRGVNTRVVRSGTIRVGDVAAKISA